MNRDPLLITSRSNDRVKDLVRLRNRRERDQSGLMLIEEPLVIRRALDAGITPRLVCYCEEQLRAADHGLLTDLLKRAVTGGDHPPEVLRFSAPVMEKVSYRDQPEGLLIVAPQKHHQLAELDLSPAPLLAVLESVEKPGNLGAMLRVADAAGCEAVIVCGQGTDLFNPNVLRASRGACFSVPTVAADSLEVQTFLDEREIRAVAASPAADQTWDQVDWTLPAAVILGTEHDGLSDQWLRAADLTVGIPMLGAADSLNVSASAAVLLFEAVRQRLQRDRSR